MPKQTTRPASAAARPAATASRKPAASAMAWSLGRMRSSASGSTDSAARAAAAAVPRGSGSSRSRLGATPTSCNWPSTASASAAAATTRRRENSAASLTRRAVCWSRVSPPPSDKSCLGRPSRDKGHRRTPVPPERMTGVIGAPGIALGLKRRAAVALPALLLVEQGGQPFDRLGEGEDLPLPQFVDLLVEQLDLELRLGIDLVILLGLQPVDVGLAVLAHHDEGRGIGRLEGEGQGEEDERIGIPMPYPGDGVEDDPGEQDGALDDDEAPASHRRGDRVGDVLACREGRGALSLPPALRPPLVAQRLEQGAL